MLEEDYCSYEVAKLLKEKGFDEESYGIYIDENTFEELDFKSSNIPETSIYRIVAPTHQMAMKWLREVYDIFIDIGYDDLDWYWLIESISKDIPYEDRPELIKNGTACHKTYEEAVEAALKYSLENLI